MIALNFSISEFVITGAEVPLVVADRILEFHIKPMQSVRDELGVAIYPSQRSAYRPRNHELNRGRSGKSQHTFGERKNRTFDEKHKGATDWTCRDFTRNKNAFLKSIIKHTNYTRIAVYATFIHCDYKAIDGKRYLFSSDTASNWKFERFINE